KDSELVRKEKGRCDSGTLLLNWNRFAVLPILRFRLQRSRISGVWVGLTPQLESVRCAPNSEVSSATFPNRVGGNIGQTYSTVTEGIPLVYLFGKHLVKKWYGTGIGWVTSR